MSRSTRLFPAAMLAFAAGSCLWANTVPTPAPASSLSIATFYNSGSGFASAWQSGGGAGNAPSGGSIIRLSAFYRDANGNITDLGQGAAIATINLTVSGHTYQIGPSAPCSCRSVEFAPAGIPVAPVSYSGATLGAVSAYTLVMTVAAAPDPNSPITAAFQYGGSNGSVNLEQNQIVYTSAQSNMQYVAVCMANYAVNTDSASDFMTFTGGSNSDTRTIYFQVAGDAKTYSATFNSSTTKVIITLAKSENWAANTTAITWWQTVPGNETVFAWFYASSNPLS